MFNTSGLDELFQILNSIKGLKGFKLRQPQWSNTTELLGILQKGWKFMSFWSKIHEPHALLAVPCPLLANNFSGVEIQGFHLQKT